MKYVGIGMIWQKISNVWQKNSSNFVIIASMAGLLLTASNLGLFRSLEWAASDQLFRLRREKGVDDNIVIVTIDEADIQNIQQWPMPDRDLAQILENIKAQNPRAIALDLYRDLAVEPGHEALRQIFQTTPNLIGIQKVAGETINPPPDLAELGQTAANDVILDADGKIRRGTVLLRNGEEGLIEGFAIKVAMMFLEQENTSLEVIDVDQNIYGLGKAKFIPLSKHDGEYRDKDMGGYQIILNYRGDLNFFQHISMTEVLNGEIPANMMRDKIVFIGPTAPSLNDIHQTPYNNSLFFSQPLVPGVVIHANLTSHIISAALDGRVMLRPTTRGINRLIIIGFVIYSTALGNLYLRNRSLVFIGLGFGIVFILASAYGAFIAGWLLPIFTPLLAILTTTTVAIISNLWLNLKHTYQQLKEQHQQLAHVYQQLEETNQSYSRFVPLDYLDFLKKEKILDVNLGDHVNRQMTILFSDIRSFTPLAEAMTPKENFDFINAYLKQLSPEIRSNNGLIVKFLGDGVMAIFPNSPNDALNSAIAQLRKLDMFNAERLALGEPPIRIGLAIHFGKIMVGIVGEESRMQNDILSDSVNLTSRLESLTKFYGVALIISETVFASLKKEEKYHIRFLDRITVKGKKNPISIYEVFDCDSEAMQAAKVSTREKYNQALDYYRQGDFIESRKIFNQLREESPDDSIFQIYIQRLDKLLRNKLHDLVILQEKTDWQGVWQFDEKY